MWKRPAAIAFLLLAGAVSTHEGRVSGAPDARADDVLEAAFREQMGLWLDAHEAPRGTVLCLAIDPGGAPQSVEKEYLGRFRSRRSLRRAAECEARPRGAVERATGLPAILITAGPIEWVGSDEAWVTVSHFRTARESGRRVYRVVREPSRWISLGPILKLSPA
jgi:hypothetical protein